MTGNLRKRFLVGTEIYLSNIFIKYYLVKIVFAVYILLELHDHIMAGAD